MLNPSYAELMEKLNTEQHVDHKITSRYTIVIAASKRARQLIDGDQPLTYAPTDKAVSIAVNEMFAGKLAIRPYTEANEPAKTGTGEDIISANAVADNSKPERYRDTEAYEFDDSEGDNDEFDDDYADDDYADDDFDEE